ALKLQERLGNPSHTAATCHQLAIIAEQRGRHAAAEKWCMRSLTIKKRLGDQHGSAITYYQLGRIAEVQQSWDSARIGMVDHWSCWNSSDTSSRPPTSTISSARSRRSKKIRAPPNGTI
ncbi:MAG: tetratricopeptide repeat protein, partial [Gammaproteobacteria bacterium]|nr:tetratricopeptide repeat protein [Gammaproteobacteria bacterium]